MKHTQKLIVYCAWCLALCAILLSCRDKSVFRLKGEIANLQQADFFVYATDGSMAAVDTIHVIEGRFDWRLPLQDEALLHVVYPNLSEQVVFARPGDVVRMTGDAGQLRAVSVKGSIDNDELTDFRLAHLSDMPDSLRRAMSAYVKEHSDSRVGLYLKRQLYLTDGQSARVRVGLKLPTLTLPPDGLDKTATDTLVLKPGKRPLLLVFWAAWKRDSRDNLLAVKHTLRDLSCKPDSLRPQPISISLDYDVNLYAYALKSDSIDFDRRCYRQVWETPICQQLAVSDLPFFILTDYRHRILAAGKDWKKEILPVVEKRFK